MQDYKTEYQRWLNSSAIDEKTRAELLSVKDNEKEQEDRFYTELEFGTAGLRGILGAGRFLFDDSLGVEKQGQGARNFVGLGGEGAAKEDA